MDEEIEKSEQNGEQCIFHSKQWRSKLQYVMNNLSGKVIPRGYIDKVRRIVCTCPDGKGMSDGYFRDWRHLHLDALKTYFESEFSKPESLLTNVQSLLMECITREKLSTSESRWRLLVLIKNCVENNFSIFNYKTPKAEPTKHLMPQKYKRDMEIQASFPLAYIRFILGANGKHIQELCKKYNCEIRFDVKRHRAEQYRSIFGTTTLTSSQEACSPVKIQLFYNDLDTPANVRDALFHHIATVVETREKHKVKVEKYRAIKMVYAQKRYENILRQRMYQDRYGCILGPAHTWGAAINRKQHLSASYKRRAHKTQKQKNMKKNQPLPPVLEGGCCRNCLQPFRKSTFKKEACKYHPGYLVQQKACEMPESLDQCSLSSENTGSNLSIPKANTLKGLYVWSCCGAVSENYNSLEIRRKGHSETGCTATVHDYRLPKSSNPKGRKSNGANHNVENIENFVG